MNHHLILFYDTNFGLAIEDSLEGKGVLYTIEKTPEVLLEMDVFFCKTMINADVCLETLQSLIIDRQLKVAATFVKVEDKFESVPLEAN